VSIKELGKPHFRPAARRRDRRSTHPQPSRPRLVSPGAVGARAGHPGDGRDAVGLHAVLRAAALARAGCVLAAARFDRERRVHLRAGHGAQRRRAPRRGRHGDGRHILRRGLPRPDRRRARGRHMEPVWRAGLCGRLASGLARGARAPSRRRASRARGARCCARRGDGRAAHAHSSGGGGGPEPAAVGDRRCAPTAGRPSAMGASPRRSSNSP
jgi:hypothetical protein